MKLEWLLAIIPTISIAIITFFIKRMIDMNDKKFKSLSNTLELIKDKQINQSEKRVEQTTEVNSALRQIHKDMEEVKKEIRDMPRLKFDVNNLGDKIRKIEDKT